MNTRSVVTSPPAVAGFVLLILVFAAILGVRSGMNDGGDTDVAGTVIERSEPTELATLDPVEPSEPVIVRPRPEPTETQAPAQEPDPVVVSAPEPPAPAPVGLIPDESAPDGGDTDGGDTNDGGTSEGDNDGRNNNSGNDGDNNPRPRPEPEPTREPQPEPDPEPTEEPTENPARYAMKTGDGYSEDTIIADADSRTWLFREVARHDGGGTDNSRAAQARLNVGFNPATQNADPDAPKRNLRCAAWLTAGDRHLTTDTEHYFTVSLYESDEYGAILDPANPVISVNIRKAYTLDAGEDTRSDAGELSTPAVTVDAADGKHYTCAVSYDALS